MTARIVRLGTSRLRDEGLRIGTVRRPPRGAPKSRFASDNWYDVWLPELSPSEATVKLGLKATSDGDWKKFIRKYESEMSAPAASRALDLLAALSHQTDFSIGCYCEDESRCHRSVLRQLLKEHGARMT